MVGVPTFTLCSTRGLLDLVGYVGPRRLGSFSYQQENPTAVFIIIEPVGLSGIDRLLAEALRVCSCKLLRIPTCLPLTNRVNVYDARCNTHASTTLQTPTSACAGRRAYLSRRRRCSPSSRPRSRRHLQGLNKLLSGMIYL